MLDLMPPALAETREQVRLCTACSARQEAASPVPGIGYKTGIVFIGKNPGETEDLQGEPFTGASGRELSKFLAICGLSRNDIFLFNLIQCHTLDNRDPTRQEVSTCVRLWVSRYLRILEPYLVVTLGAPAGKYLAGISSISKQHGTLYRHARGWWTIPCYHPGSVLYDGSIKMRSAMAYDAEQVKRFLVHRDQYIAQLREPVPEPEAAPI